MGCWISEDEHGKHIWPVGSRHFNCHAKYCFVFMWSHHECIQASLKWEWASVSVWAICGPQANFCRVSRPSRFPLKIWRHSLHWKFLPSWLLLCLFQPALNYLVVKHDVQFLFFLVKSYYFYLNCRNCLRRHSDCVPSRQIPNTALTVFKVCIYKIFNEWFYHCRHRIEFPWLSRYVNLQ